MWTFVTPRSQPVRSGTEPPQGRLQNRIGRAELVRVRLDGLVGLDAAAFEQRSVRQLILPRGEANLDAGSNLDRLGVPGASPGSPAERPCLRRLLHHQDEGLAGTEVGRADQDRDLACERRHAAGRLDRAVEGTAERARPRWIDQQVPGIDPRLGYEPARELAGEQFVAAPVWTHI